MEAQVIAQRPDGKMPHPLLLGFVSNGVILVAYLGALLSSVTSPWISPATTFITNLAAPVILLSTVGNSLLAYAIAKRAYGNGKGILSYGAGTVIALVIVGFLFVALVVIAALFSVAASGGQ